MKTIVYSGTFDPPTNGHVNIVKLLTSIPDVDTIYVCPSFNPLKSNTSHFVHRVEMCKLAFDGIDERIVVSNMENELFEMTKGYTYNLINELKAWTGDGIRLVIGYDLVDEISSKWFKGDKLINECDFIIVPRRDGSGKVIEPTQQWYKKPNHTILDVEATTFSSSEIRTLVYSGGDVSALLPINVIEYITKVNLYAN